MTYTSQNFHLFHVSNFSILNFRICSAHVARVSVTVAVAESMCTLLMCCVVSGDGGDSAAGRGQRREWRGAQRGPMYPDVPGSGGLSGRTAGCDPGYMSRKIRKFGADKFGTGNKRKFRVRVTRVNG